jgi:hypothetical protein
MVYNPDEVEKDYEKYNGQLRKLKTKLNNKDTCQCYRGNFI